MDPPEDYTTFALHKVPHATVVKRLSNLKRVAIVSPTVKEFTFVYDKKTANEESAITVFGRELSNSLRCPVLAVRFKDRTLSYWLFTDGALADSYCDKLPGGPTDDYGYAVPQGGVAERLAAAFGFATYSPLIESVLRDRNTSSAERHVVLAFILGMPRWLIQRTFSYGQDLRSMFLEQGFARVKSR